MKAACALPPRRGDFVSHFAALNRLAMHAVTAMVVRPGMEFGARQTWWRPATARPLPHAGLDLASYRDGQGRDRPLPEGAHIPALYPGEAGAIFADFLGQSVLLCHPFADQRGWRFCTIYGHLLPAPGLVPGAQLAAGDLVGAVAWPAGAGAAPHLHLSLGWLAPALLGPTLDWPTLERSPLVQLLDPTPFLGQGQLLEGNG